MGEKEKLRGGGRVEDSGGELTPSQLGGSLALSHFKEKPISWSPEKKKAKPKR